MARPRRSSPVSTVAARFDVIAVGASWGGVDALGKIVHQLPETLAVAMVVVQHQHAYSGNALQRILSRRTGLPVFDVDDKEEIRPGGIYIAPANYHLLIENDGSFSLSLEAPVNFSRPSIDVTFNSLAERYQRRCIGVLLTGANDDGVDGLRNIKRHGGVTIAQDPATAEVPVMPEAAISAGVVDHVIGLTEMVPFLMQLLRDGKA